MKVWNFVLAVVFACFLFLFISSCEKVPPHTKKVVDSSSTLSKPLNHLQPTPKALEKISEPFVIPAGINSIIEHVEAERLDNGRVVFVGKIHLPKGTAFMLTLGETGKRGKDRPKGQAKLKLKKGGKFRTEPFTSKGKPHKAGNYSVNLFAHFNASWKQPHDTMAVAGKDGLSLPEKLSIPYDKEFPGQGRYIDVTKRIMIPPLTPKYVALHAVKKARLTLPEKGRSTKTVEENFIIKLFSTDKRYEHEWLAEKNANGLWIVTFKYKDSGKPEKAQWQYNPRTRSVKYLDYHAKNFSWSSE